MTLVETLTYRFVMCPTLEYFNLPVFNAIDKAVCFINTSAPKTFQVVFQGFGFALRRFVVSRGGCCYILGKCYEFSYKYLSYLF